MVAGTGGLSDPASQMAVGHVRKLPEKGIRGTADHQGHKGDNGQGKEGRMNYIYATFFYIFTVPREWKNTAHHRYFA
tara:strand:- start:27 stop:257 length:231 start_codon:yes stop_codon:yes gene_type:complete